jgi:hypothetical protein
METDPAITGLLLAVTLYAVVLQGKRYTIFITFSAAPLKLKTLSPADQRRVFY